MTQKKRRAADVMLSAVSQTQHGEAETAILLTINVFLLLVAYYFLKVAREPLILVGGGGAAVKSYASAGMAVILIFVTYTYGKITQLVDRVKLISFVYLFFVSNLAIFAFLWSQDVNIGVAFFLWVGIFNMMAIAQFWGFAADIYSEERGKRLFPILGVGASLGAAAGAWIADFAEKWSPAVLMLIAAGLLVVCVALTVIVDRHERARAEDEDVDDAATAKREAAQKFGPASGWSLLVRDKYLILIGLMMFAVNWVNSNGEFIVSKTVLAAASGDDAARELFVKDFFARYFFWVNIVALALQVIAVPRIIKYVGVRGALFVLPAVSLIAYGSLSVAPILSIIFVAKVAENSLDYSLQNTARNALWLVTTREAKYKVKNVVDTFLVRAGDVASAGAVALLPVTLGLSTRAFAAFNVALVAGWIFLIVLIAREHKKRSKEHPAGAKVSARP